VTRPRVGRPQRYRGSIPSRNKDDRRPYSVQTDYQARRNPAPEEVLMKGNWKAMGTLPDQDSLLLPGSQSLLLSGWGPAGKRNYLPIGTEHWYCSLQHSRYSVSATPGFCLVTMDKTSLQHALKFAR
jgi:hypothetical protein